MKIYLIRHGQSAANRGICTGKETVLTTIGIEQSKRTGLYFKKKNINRIYCSKMIRAIDTLKEIKTYLPNISITYTKKINERSRGIYNEKPKEYEKALKACGKPSHKFRPPKGENLFDLEKRAKKFLEYLKKKHPKDNVLVVAHGLFLRFLILRIFKLHMKEGQYFELHNAGLSTFIFDEDLKLTKFEIDDYKHLIKYSSYSREIKEMKK